jgi:hypothetical protein
MNGGSAWESNPPGTRKAPRNGFEVREAHRDLSAPETGISISQQAVMYQDVLTPFPRILLSRGCLKKLRCHPDTERIEVEG